MALVDGAVDERDATEMCRAQYDNFARFSRAPFIPAVSVLLAERPRRDEPEDDNIGEDELGEEECEEDQDLGEAEGDDADRDEGPDKGPEVADDDDTDADPGDDYLERP